MCTPTQHYFALANKITCLKVGVGCCSHTNAVACFINHALFSTCCMHVFNHTASHCSLLTAVTHTHTHTNTHSHTHLHFPHHPPSHTHSRIPVHKHSHTKIISKPLNLLYYCFFKHHSTHLTPNELNCFN